MKEFDPKAHLNWSPAAQEKALEALNRARNDAWRPFYCPRPGCDGKPHDDWVWNHARADQHPPKGDWTVWLQCSGRGCVAPWTRLFNPLTGEHVRVDQITTTVPVWSTEGVAWTDGAPFVKGVADLWTVTCEDGSVITVTDQHRFLTPQGWQRLADVRVGQQLAAVPHAQPSTAGLCRPGLPEDDMSWTRICSIEYSHYGVFYDLTVPGPENYAAEGLVSHNSGKTRSGSEYTHKMVQHVPRITLVGPTSGDVRDVMIDGESGLMATAPPGFRPKHEPSKRRLTWPNGATALLLSAEEPERFRGPQHYFTWCDEGAIYTNIDDLWSNLLFGLRLGKNPKALVTTTPRPTQWLKDLIVHPRTELTRASTFDNLDNLAPTFREEILRRYEGTRIGRQELYAEVLGDVEGSLWTLSMIEDCRVRQVPEELDRIVVAIDPAGTSNKRSDETGIIVAGQAGDHTYILADRSGKYSPKGWADAAQHAYEEFSADAIIVERNYGGDMVMHTLKSSGVTGRVQQVLATRGKAIRAEPVVSLFEQDKCHIVGSLPDLETQLIEWVPAESKKSPDRLDAMVWAVTALMRRNRIANLSSPLHLVQGGKAS